MIVKPSFAACCAWAVLIVAADQVTKLVATETLHYAVPFPVAPSFNFTLLHNPGAAFSFLASAGGWQRWFFTALAIIASGYIVYLLRVPTPNSASYRTGLALVLGGAIGNLVDRISLGYVVDFIQVYYQDWFFPAFNIADSAITVGAMLLLFSAFTDGHSEAAHEPNRSV